MSEYRTWKANGGEGPLIDDVQQIKERDFADSDVRAAVASVRERENRETLARDMGAEGIRAAEMWDRRIEQVGPNVALEAAQLYQRAPRLAEKPEDVRESDNDHMSATRRAYHQAKAKAERDATLPAALEGYDRIVQRHGTPDILNNFKRWDQQLRANPQDAGPRVAEEIAQHVNSSILDQQLLGMVNDYEARHEITPEERAMMQHALNNGWAPADMRHAHEYARFLLASDIEDPHQRDVVASQRQLSAPDAKAEVAEFERHHPGARHEQNGRVWGRMRQLLETYQAKDLDDAYMKARR